MTDERSKLAYAFQEIMARCLDITRDGDEILGTGDASFSMADHVLRIRAETAKNSGEAVAWKLVPIIPTDRMIEDAGQLLSPSQTLTECYDQFTEIWDQALASSPPPPTLANSPSKNSVEATKLADLIEWLKAWAPHAKNGMPEYAEKYLLEISELLATPANSRSEAIGVKPLEWENLGGGVYKAPSPLFGSIRVEPCGSEYCVTWSVPGMCDTFTKGFFGTPDAAKAAAQADYEQRIRSALLQQEGE